MKKIFFLLIAALTGLGAWAQNRNYKNIDDKVAALGAMPAENVATIAEKVTGMFSDKEDMARAIFYWIANNIEIDPKATKNQDQRKILPEEIIKYRKATPLGMANLYQEMASDAGIRCLSVDGFVKNSWQDINEIPDEPNFSWNVVQLGTSPDQWFYVDVAGATGFLDADQKVFTKKFTSKYFFTDKALFNLTHFADNIAWQLGPSPKTLKEFYSLPVLKTSAYDLGVVKISPTTGFIKTKTTKSINYTIAYNGNDIKTVSLLIGADKKKTKSEPMNFSMSNNTISFAYTFKTEDNMPVKIVVDGVVLAEYVMEVEE